MALSNTSAKAAVILSDPSTYDQWFENIRGSVPEHLWKYFDPDSDAVFVEPIPPIQPTLDDPPDGETPARRVAREKEHEKQLESYYKQHQIFDWHDRKWEKYNDVLAKLRDRIQSTVARQKSSSLRTNLPVRKWLTDLRASSSLPLATIQMNIRVEYGRFMHQALGDWPSGGPSNWLAKWEDLICRAKQYDEPLRSWLMDVTLVWTNVHDLNVFFKTVEFAIRKGDVAQYDQASISAKIQQCWEVKKQGSTLQLTKPKPTRSAFTAATFDGEEPPEAEDADVTFNGEEPPETEDAEAEKGKQKKRSKNRNDARRGVGAVHLPPKIVPIEVIGNKATAPAKRAVDPITRLEDVTSFWDKTKTKIGSPKRPEKPSEII